jgi:nucleotide-binding universal stress UspA family protein
MLAREEGVALCCFSVEQGLPTYAGTIDAFEDVKEERDTYYTEGQTDAKRITAEHGIEVATRIEAGHPAQTIVRVVNDGGYDLVVMRHREHCRVWTTFMGTTVEKVRRHVTCSVLVVR